MDNRFRKKVYNGLMIFFAISLSISIYYLGHHKIEKVKAENDFKAIREAKAENIQSIEKEEIVENEEIDRNYAEQNGLKKWYENLYLENSDMMCWITLEDSGIDYPVMYSNSEYYLRRNFEKDYSISGTPFFDRRTPLEEENDDIDLNIIYGHNMKDGTMFSDLKLFEKKENIEKAKPIVIETLNNKYEYKIFASLIVKEYTPLSDRIYTKTSFKNEKDYTRYMKMIKRNTRNMIETEEKGDILLLSTCSSRVDRGRLIVFAIKIDENN